MGRKSITGGVTPAGPSRVQFDFVIDGVRFRPTLPWPPTASNLERARKHLARIKAQIEAGTFCFAEVFPDYKGLTKVPATARTRSCGEIFDDFLHHERRRVARGDLAPVTLTSHRQILDHVWRPHLGRLPFLGIPHSMLIKIADAQNWNRKTYNNAISALRRAFAFGYLDYPERRDPAASLKCSRIGKKDRPAIDPFSIQDAEVLIAALHRDWGQAQGNYDELRFFTGLRPSEEIALVISDYDRRRGVLSVTKARVGGIDKDCTKTGEDRRIVLCPRAIAIIERQLRLRERLARAGIVQHQHLFFTDEGKPIPDVKYPYCRWERTLKQLAIRYRKPYTARHTSVSWNLMLGRNPLLVAKEHGHRIITMLTVYAAWTEGAVESDIAAIRAARNQKRSSARYTRSAVRNATIPTRTYVHEEPINPPVRVDHPELTSLAAFVIGSAEEFCSRFGSDGAAEWLQPRSDRIDGEEFGSGFASSSESLLVANYMNNLRKSGGADGTRTRPLL
jgi:integrase